MAALPFGLERTIGGVTILLPLEDASYGGRGYTCRDLEGHVWTFGTYDPLSDA